MLKAKNTFRFYAAIGFCGLTLPVSANVALDSEVETDSEVEVASSTDAKFPDMRNFTERGRVTTIVRPQDLAVISQGMRKDQVYAILGRASFFTGFNAKKWDYVVQLVDGDGTITPPCQYQVQFSSRKFVSRTVWRTASCADSYEALISQNER